jgi:hypothetical protein
MLKKEALNAEGPLGLRLGVTKKGVARDGTWRLAQIFKTAP